MAAPGSLRIGLNLVYLAERSGGVGTYGRELLRALLEEEPDTRVTAFVSAEAPADVVNGEWPGEVEFVRFPVTVTHGPPGSFAAAMASQWAVLPLIAARRRLHVLHGLANVGALVAPRMASVVTLHDLIWVHHPETMDEAAVTGIRRVVPISARRADRVLADSHAAADDIAATLGIRRDRIDVAPLGVRRPQAGRVTAEDELRARLGIADGPVVLCVAQKREHKNLLALVRALPLIADEHARLVVPGSPTPYEDELRRVAADLGVGERLVLPGWLDDADMEGLWRMARCFALPSLREGFGLPVLEAMARDVPVACSEIAPLTEVAGDAALLFDPHSTEAVAAAVSRLLSDDALRRRLVDRGHARCERFSWRATARATLASYRRAIDQRRAAA